MDGAGRPLGIGAGEPAGDAPLTGDRGVPPTPSTPTQDALRDQVGRPGIERTAAASAAAEGGAFAGGAAEGGAVAGGAVTGGAGADEGDAVVLVVEDDAELRVLLTRIIGVAHRVVAVADAESALVAAPRLRPDVIMCDLSLPGVDGEELLRRLRAAADTADIPVVVVSGRADEASRVRLLHAGAVDYVTKPFLPGELRARIANVLAGRRDRQRLRAQAEQADARAQQLQHALDSRVIVEQAKGVLAATYGVTIPVAYERLRRYARDRNRKLHDVARAVVTEGLRP